MAVVKIERGEVVQTWRDVSDVAAAVAKYGLDPANLVEGDHAPGTLWDGTTFTIPVRTPVVEPENQVIQALRDLADDLGPQHAAKINSRFGPRPNQGSG